MLDMRPTCENCNKALPHNSEEAMICTFECTFCEACAETVLQHVCPNCGGNFRKRPIRPEYLLKKFPVSVKVTYKPIDVEAHMIRIKKAI